MVPMAGPNSNSDDIMTPLDLEPLILQYLIDERIPNPYLPPNQRISIYNSAIAEFPYSLCEPNGRMRRERFRACQKWRGGPGRYDCVFIATKHSPGMQGLSVARLKLIFSFKYEENFFPCVVVQWFPNVSDSPDTVTGLYTVSPERDRTMYQVVSAHTVFRAAHLLPVYSTVRRKPPSRLTALDDFRVFYVNKYVDLHAFDTLSR